MTPSSPKLSHAIDRIHEIELDSWLSEPTDVTPSHSVRIVFLSTDSCELDLNSGLQAELLSCDSLHNFFRLGYHQQPFVLVTVENRQECSAKDLEVLLSRRSPNPFRLILKDNKSSLTLSQEVNEALVEVHACLGLEKRVSEKTRAIFRETHPESSPYSSREFQQANKILRERVRKRIENEPEKFLQDAISRIRK
jgi:hypothetical protein